LHRNVSLLSIVFVALHVVTSVLDGYAPISMVDAIVPFASDYRPFWLSLGAVSFDLLLALVITSMLRARISHGAWRYTHWLAYASWPIALLHSFGTGSDARNAWLLWLSVGCVAVVAAAVLARALPAFEAHPVPSGVALGATAAFAVFLAIWLPWGPLAKNWASRAGTPASLLGHHAGATTKGASAAAGAATSVGGGGAVAAR
jgi:predicted ferric reductase